MGTAQWYFFYFAAAKNFSGLFPLNYFDNLLIKRSQQEPWTFDKIKRIPKLKVYIAATPTDHFGFYEGNLRLLEKFKSLGAELTYDEQDVRHCRIDGQKLSQFLTK